MGKYYQYVAVFETAILRGSSQKLIVDPLKIELLPRIPRQYVAQFGSYSVLPKGEPSLLMRSGPLLLKPPTKYIVLTARVSEVDDPDAIELSCDALVDRGVTALSAMLGSEIFSKLVYRGGLRPSVDSSRGGLSGGQLQSTCHNRGCKRSLHWR